MAKATATKPARAAAQKTTRKKTLPIQGATLSGDATVSSIIAGAGGSRVPDFETYYYAATKHPYVRGCIELIADTAAAEGFDLVPIDEEDAKPLSGKDDPRVTDLHEFLRNAFPGATFGQWRWAASFDVLAYGVSLLRKKMGAGTLVALERLDPRCVVAKLNATKTAIDSFVVRPRAINGRVDPTVVEIIPAKEVILFARYGGDPITGFPSPLEALDLTLFCDFAARRFRSAFFNNGGVPSMVITMAASDEDSVRAVAENLRKQKSGANNAYKLWVLAGDDMKVNEIGEAGKHDADFVQASGLNREDVCAIYKVPVGMLTFSANALGSSGKGQDQSFFEQFAVLPLEELLCERLTLSLLADAFGIDDIAFVPKRRNRIRFDRFDAAMNAVKFGATGNEARRMVQLPPITDPKFDMDSPLFIGASKMGVVADEPTAEGTEAANPQQQDGSGNAGAAADAAGNAHDENEVAKKASSRFRFRGL